LFALLQKLGPRLRQKVGTPGWVNPEFDTFLTHSD
jgi:hypothetical protein